jgi:hypothetical protein
MFDDRRSLVRNQLCELSQYSPNQPIDQTVLKKVLDDKKNGIFEDKLFEMIYQQTEKLYDGEVTIENFAEVYCQAEENLVKKSQKIEEEIKNHKLKQEEYFG